MYEEHPVFKAPKRVNQKIWRYIDFSKYVSLISTSSLYFAAASAMQDKFEGSYSLANLDFRKEAYPMIPIEKLEELHVYTKSMRDYTFLNCWHMADYESVAMWGLYQSEGRGLAIKSTYARLRDCFQSNQTIHMGVVKYVDYTRHVIPEGNIFYPYIHKRRSFEHEHEIRAVIQPSKRLGPTGIQSVEFNNSIPVDLSKLIVEVHVAPATPDWYLEAVLSVTRKYGLNIPVIRSALDKDPVF